MNTVGEMLLKNILPKRRNAAMTLQRQLPQIQPEVNHKLMHTAQKKKPKDMLTVQGANVFS
jgi:hypothetical protein